jgi:two-component system NarL family sensor kinase
MIQFTVIGIVMVTIVGLATATASRRIGQREAITDARTQTLVKAQGLVEPTVTPALVSGDAAAVAAVDRVVRRGVLDRSLVRVKIWRSDGRIVYSDDPRLQGRTFELDEDDRAAFDSGLIHAGVTDLSKPENRYEDRYQKLLEVYLPIRVPDGKRLLFEAYFRYDSVSAAGRRIWGSFAPVAIGALVVLELLQIPLAWSLARRLRQRQREREALLQRSLDASDVERRRIASDLHDGVVQEIAGAAYLLSAAPTDGDDAGRTMDQAATILRRSVTSLRSTLVEIYPPHLGDAGLVAALTDLAQDTSDDGLAITLDAAALRADLPSAVSALLYRATREALRNVRRHAEATTAAVRAGSDARTAWVEIVDDGIGFDTSSIDARAAEGHIGLRGLDGLLGDAGGRLDISSRPGLGTSVRVEVPVA